MTAPPVSVVIVSRGRPAALRRCLAAVAQLQYPAFEVVVVADPDGVATARATPTAEALKIVPYDVPNISAARNLGISHAAGEIVAFIDDDAVPEPQWLRHLTAPAERPEVAAMGGFVRGRNGISFQWKARRIDGEGMTHDLPVDAQRPVLLTPPPGQAIKTEGTNMAVRREVLVALGGFDPAYHYFLDETDLNMRLARAGHATAIVPLAEVHHGFAPNALRRADRVQRDLFEIGASWAVFQRKYLAPPARATHWQRLRAGERRRLLGHLVTGGLEPRDVGWLMRRLEDGYVAGQARALATGALPHRPAAPFRPFPSEPRRPLWIASRPWHLRRDRDRAAREVAAGRIVTLLSLSPTALYHRLLFDPEGFWLQRGGLFGRSDRTMPLFRLTTRRRRQIQEKRRIARQRGLH